MYMPKITARRPLCARPSTSITFNFYADLSVTLFQDDVRCMLVLEYAAGGELLHRIRKRLRLPDGEARFYAAEVADALQYMHNEVGECSTYVPVCM